MSDETNELDEAIAVHGPRVVFGLTRPVEYGLDVLVWVLGIIAWLLDAGAALRERIARR